MRKKRLPPLYNLLRPSLTHCSVHGSLPQMTLFLPNPRRQANWDTHCHFMKGKLRPREVKAGQDLEVSRVVVPTVSLRTPHLLKGGGWEI